VRVIVITDENEDQKGEYAAGVLLTDFTFCLAIFLSANTHTHRHTNTERNTYINISLRPAAFMTALLLM